MSGDYAVPGVGHRVDPYTAQQYMQMYGNQYVTDSTAVQAQADTTYINTPPNQGTTTNSSSSGSAWGLIGTTVLAIGAAALTKRAHTVGGAKGAKGLWNQISTGFKDIFKGNFWKGIFKGSKTAEQGKAYFTVGTHGGKQVCTIPGQRNIIKGTDAATRLQAIGGKTDMPALTDKGVEFLGYKFKLTDGYSVVYHQKTGVTHLYDKNGKLAKTISQKRQKEIDKIIAKVKKKDKTTLDSLENVYFSHTEGGITRKFMTQHTDSAKNGFRSAEADFFTLDSTQAKAFFNSHESEATLAKAFKEGKVKDLAIDEAGLSLKLGSKNYDFKIVGDEIAEVTVGGKTYKRGSMDFEAIMYDHGKEIKKAFENKKKWAPQWYRC